MVSKGGLVPLLLGPPPPVGVEFVPRDQRDLEAGDGEGQEVLRWTRRVTSSFVEASIREQVRKGIEWREPSA